MCDAAKAASPQATSRSASTCPVETPRPARTKRTIETIRKMSCTSLPPTRVLHLGFYIQNVGIQTGGVPPHHPWQLVLFQDGDGGVGERGDARCVGDHLPRSPDDPRLEPRPP